MQKRFSEEQIVQILREAEKGEHSMGEVCRAHGIAPNTFYRWRHHYGGMQLPEVKRLKELEKENARLKRLLAERCLEIDAMQGHAGRALKKLLSAQQRRYAVQGLHEHGLSVRRSCALCGISRSSYSYRPSPEKQHNDQVLGQQLQAIARYHHSYGYRPAHRELCRQGEAINHKRVQRVWRLEGLSLPLRCFGKRIRTGAGVPTAATRPNEVWTYDFIQDTCNRGHRLKFLTITDEFTRQSLAVVTATSIRAQRVRQELERLFVRHGAPACIRSDNGPEFVAQPVKQWLQEQGVQTLYIAPGCPWQNAYAESFHSRFRAECLDRQWFHTVREAAVVVQAWRRYYNQERLHSSLDYVPPDEFERSWHLARQHQSTYNTAILPL